jgi:hypothetical protein
MRGVVSEGEYLCVEGFTFSVSSLVSAYFLVFIMVDG